jgi:hypothetical protein
MTLPMTLPAAPASCPINWKHSKMTLMTLMTLVCLPFLVRQARGYVRNVVASSTAPRLSMRSTARLPGCTLSACASTASGCTDETPPHDTSRLDPGHGAACRP